MPTGWCPQTYQELIDAIINGTQVTFLIDTGNFLYNMGSVTPDPENRIFPWLFTGDGTYYGRWYTFNYGLWVSPMDPSSRETTFRKMWKPANGTLESAVWSLDQGSGEDPSIVLPTATDGATWEVDHDMDGIFPVGVGTIPGSSDSIALGDTGGEYEHTLTEAEGAVGQHVHPMGFGNTGTGDLGLNFVNPAVSTPAYSTFFNSSGAPSGTTTTSANLVTLPANNGSGVTADPFKIYPKYRGIYWVKPTARKFYTLPA